MKNMNRFFQAGLVALAASVTAIEADAQQAKATQQTFGNWVVTCPAKTAEGKQPSCFARVTINDQKRKITLASWTVGFNSSGTALMEVVSPVDVLIELGVSLKLEPGGEVKLPYHSCGLKGCLSRITIDKSLIQKMKAANKASISISTTNGKIITFGIGMTGSAKALSALKL